MEIVYIFPHGMVSSKKSARLKILTERKAALRRILSALMRIVLRNVT